MPESDYKIKLYYFYCSLDKMHEYQIVMLKKESDPYDNDLHWGNWVWFYLGTRLARMQKDFSFFRILPYEISYGDSNKLLAKYKGQHAEKTANYIADKILNHLTTILK